MSRYTDIDALKRELIYRWNVSDDVDFNNKEVWQALEKALTIDIVRCQDCKYWVYNFNGCSRNPCTEPWYATDFCNYGEREGE